MALLFRNKDGTYRSRCSICAECLTDPVFATTHFIDDQSDRLYEYSDSAMHWDCYANWKYQKRFANQYFESVLEWKQDNPHWPTVFLNEDSLVRVGRSLPEPEIDMDFRTIGPGLRIRLSDWELFLDSGWRNECCHPLQIQTLEECLPAINSDLPTVKSILDQIPQEDGK